MTYFLLGGVGYLGKRRWFRHLFQSVGRGLSAGADELEKCGTAIKKLAGRNYLTENAHLVTLISVWRPKATGNHSRLYGQVTSGHLSLAFTHK